MNNKNRILVWVIVLLILLNVTTIATIIYHNRQEKKDAETVILTGKNQNPLNGFVFKQELGFSNDQMDAFREANRKFQPVSNEIIFELDLIKHQLFDELNKENVDSATINQLTLKIGELHSELKQETNRFYLKLKEVGNEQQDAKLKELFAPLFYQDAANKIKNRGGQGKGQGQRHRHQYGNSSQSSDSISN